MEMNNFTKLVSDLILNSLDDTIPRNIHQVCISLSSKVEISHEKNTVELVLVRRFALLFTDASRMQSN